MTSYKVFTFIYGKMTIFYFFLYIYNLYTQFKDGPQNVGLQHSWSIFKLCFIQNNARMNHVIERFQCTIHLQFDKIKSFVLVQVN